MGAIWSWKRTCFSPLLILIFSCQIVFKQVLISRGQYLFNWYATLALFCKCSLKPRLRLGTQVHRRQSCCASRHFAESLCTGQSEKKHFHPLNPKQGLWCKRINCKIMREKGKKKTFTLQVRWINKQIRIEGN